MDRNNSVLVLNADYRPHTTVSWKQAIIYLVKGSAQVLESYQDWTVRSASWSLKVPSVIVLNTYVHFKHEIKFTRSNIYARDSYQCMYCGLQAGEGKPLRVRDLTFDHVKPQSQGGPTSWDNITTACQECNCKKADKTLKEVGMVLQEVPKKPNLKLGPDFFSKGKQIHESWKLYLKWQPS